MPSCVRTALGPCLSWKHMAWTRLSPEGLLLLLFLAGAAAVELTEPGVVPCHPDCSPHGCEPRMRCVVRPLERLCVQHSTPPFAPPAPPMQRLWRARDVHVSRQGAHASLSCCYCRCRRLCLLLPTAADNLGLPCFPAGVHLAALERPAR